MVFKYDSLKQIFFLERVKNSKAKTDEFRSACMVKDSDDSTIVQMSVWNPIQNVFPSDVLDEIHYKLAVDTVDYIRLMNILVDYDGIYLK
jgi:hypothetical protein